MSAEHATSPPPFPVNTSGTAHVIDLNKRRLGGRGRQPAMTTPTNRTGGTAPGPGPSETSRILQQLAEELELSFNDIQQSLTSPAMKTAFECSLDIFQRALENSHAHGILTTDQLAELKIVMDGMRQASRLL